MTRDRVRSALVGLATRPAQPAPPVVTAACGDDTPAERRFLLAAGVEDLRSSAGRVPAAAAALPPAAPEESVDECSLRAAALLREILECGDKDLLAEAAERLRAIGRRLPAALLPDVMATPHQPGGAWLGAALRPVLGERGRWLAQFFAAAGAWALVPEGEGPPGPEDDALWSEGTVAQRAAVLAKFRRAAAGPARERLQAVWKSERADERARFLAILETNLGPEDEAFLESALDDRSAGVREVAARLLSRLPSSAFARRAEERAAGLLRFGAAPAASLWQKIRGAAPKATLDAAPPPEIPKDWARDGLAGAPLQGIGERAWRLVQALALVPPSRWSARFASSPEALIAACEGAEWRGAILHGWAVAAAAFRDDAWAEPLSAAWSARPAPIVEPPGLAASLHQTLVETMSAPAAERALTALLADARTASGVYALALQALPRPWSDAFTRAVLSERRHHLANFGRASTSMNPEHLALGHLDWMAAIAPLVPLSHAAEVASLASSLEFQQPSHARRRDDLVHRLRLRQRIREEITP